MTLFPPFMKIVVCLLIFWSTLVAYIVYYFQPFSHQSQLWSSTPLIYHLLLYPLMFLQTIFAKRYWHSASIKSRTSDHSTPSLTNTLPRSCCPPLKNINFILIVIIIKFHCPLRKWWNSSNLATILSLQRINLHLWLLGLWLHLLIFINYDALSGIIIIIILFWCLLQ